ncbi:MAG: hypothetical protein U5Q44_00710 [Dehalococcoidia bacterium]|nr:hypothetical protein [Dehalococcoidia bacterium]
MRTVPQLVFKLDPSLERGARLTSLIADATRDLPPDDEPAGANDQRADAGGPEGILLIDKEPGWTSHDVVAKARRLTGQRRIGHTGTLDPAATGLLVLCLGRATRLVEYMSGQDKVYEGDTWRSARRPIRTTPTATVIERAAASRQLDDAKLEDVATGFRGDISQLPPAYSAVKVDGKRAYALARKGESPDLRPRDGARGRAGADAHGERRGWYSRGVRRRDLHPQPGAGHRRSPRVRRAPCEPAADGSGPLLRGRSRCRSTELAGPITRGASWSRPCARWTKV